MPGGSDDSFANGHDDTTKPGGGSVLTNAIRNLRLSLHEIDRDLDETTRNFEGLEESEREYALTSLAAKMGELGDICHDTRRAIKALADDGSYALISY